MGQPVSILPGILGFATDIAPDKMTEGYMLDLVDVIPDRQEARLTNRGAWLWGSQDLGSPVETGILATPSVGPSGPAPGEQVWVQTADGTIWASALNATTGEMVLTSRMTGATRANQNQVQLGDTVIHFAVDGSKPPLLMTDASIGYANPAHKSATVGTVFKSYLVTGGAPGEPHVLRFTVPGKNLANADSYDDKSNYLTDERITALATLRGLILVFHPGHVERLRGSTPARTPIGVDPAAEGDMYLEKAFDRVGCSEPRSIAYWNEYCIFADEHGVHLTDGSTIRNLVVEGLILNTWRQLFYNKTSISGTVFMNYYICTLRAAGNEPRTLVCNLNTRRWFRFKNIDALTFFASSGSLGMERVWAGIGNRLARVSPCFFPIEDDVAVIDANNVWVQPHFITPYNKLGQEGRKRIRFLYLSYDIRKPNPPLDPRAWPPAQLTALGSVAPFYRPPIPDPPPAAPRPPVPDPPPPVPRPPIPPNPYDKPPDPAPGEDPEWIAFTFNDPNVLQVGYIVNSPTYPNPNMPTPDVVQAGWLPEAQGYARMRLPVGKLGYGISIFADITMPIGYFRLYDIAIEYGAVERSRV
jgi:hypothetical protein